MQASKSGKDGSRRAGPGRGAGPDLEPAALADALTAHRDRLARMIAFRLDRRLAHRVDVDDVLQEVYVNAAQRIGHFRDQGEHSLFVWLRLIVEQTLVDLHRRHLRAVKRDVKREVPMHRAAGGDDTSVLIHQALAAPGSSPSSAAIRAERGEQLQAVLDKMNVLDREVLALRHFEELTNGEVAEVLGISPKAASIRYVRAMDRLRQFLVE